MEQQASDASLHSKSDDYEMVSCGARALTPAAPAAEADERVMLWVDVCLKETSTAAKQDVTRHVQDYLSTQSLCYRSGNFTLDSADDFLQEHVESIAVECSHNPAAHIQEGTPLLFWQVEFAVHVYQLSEEGPADADAEDAEEGISSYQEYELPAREFHGLWDSLIFVGDIKQRLVSYASTALHFSDCKVNSQLVSFNRTALLHGPAGTGKTSMCKALAQHLSIRFQHRYKHSQLIEVNAHSLFSKYFSESGKLVSRLFSRIREQVEEADTLVFVLIDEVESLTAARQSAVAGNEPADAIRAVNALLTQLDNLKAHTNVMILTTSNITEAIDLAFVDRADIKAYIGPPSWQARYEILRSCISELQRRQILTTSDPPLPNFTEAMKDCMTLDPEGSHERTVVTAISTGGITATSEILAAALESEGLSGRSLRKLPFLAYAGLHGLVAGPCSVMQFASALKNAVMREVQERSLLQKANAS